MKLFFEGNNNQLNTLQDLNIVYAVYDDQYSKIWEHNIKRKALNLPLRIYKATPEEVLINFNYHGLVFPVIYLIKDQVIIAKKYGFLDINQLYNDFVQH